MTATFLVPELIHARDRDAASVIAVINLDRSWAGFSVLVYGAALAWGLMAYRANRLRALRKIAFGARGHSMADLAPAAEARALGVILILSVATAVAYVLLGHVRSNSGEVVYQLLYIRDFTSGVPLSVVVVTANFTAFGAFLVTTLDGNITARHAFRSARVLTRESNSELYRAVSGYFWLTVAAAVLWALYVIGFALASWSETDKLFPADEATLVGSLVLVPLYSAFVWVFLLRPLIDTHSEMLVAKTNAVREVEARFSRLRSERSSERPTELLAELELVERLAPSWPLPVDQLRAALVAVAIPVGVFALNAVRVARELANPDSAP